MTTNPRPAQDPALTISELAARTGLTPAVLRTWESRHGFPRPTRLESGHRRYGEGDVALVAQVLRRRDAGVRLETAIAEAARAHEAEAEPHGPSVFATLRRRHPHLQPQTLRKSTLLALSWALEDEYCARAEQPVLFGAFQHARFFGHSASRWGDLARTARRTTVFADLDGDPASPPGVDLVDLPAGAPMRREWSVVCDAADHPAAMAAWELPGQGGAADADRLFEAVWTLEPPAVRDAARTCAGLARQWGAEPVQLDEDLPLEASEDLRAATTMFSRVLSYADRLPHR